MHKSMFFIRSFFCTLVVLPALLLADMKADAGEMRLLRIGTGSTAGTYFPVGTLIASVISNPPGSRACEKGGSCGVPGLVAIAQSTEGSIANIDGMIAGNLEAGLVQSDIAYAAYYGKGTFMLRGPRRGIRAIAALYPESMHLVVRRGSGIETPADLKGRRISLGPEGSGTNTNARLVLRAYGLSLRDYIALSTTPAEAVDMLAEGKLDAFFFVGGYPLEAVRELARENLIELLPITGKAARTLTRNNPFFSFDSIPAGVYEGLGPVQTLAVQALLLVRADLKPGFVYELTKALWHPSHRQILDSGHVKARQIRLENACRGVSIPLHAGARKFYEEALKPEDLTLCPEAE